MTQTELTLHPKKWTTEPHLRRCITNKIQHQITLPIFGSLLQSIFEKKRGRSSGNKTKQISIWTHYRHIVTEGNNSIHSIEINSSRINRSLHKRKKKITIPIWTKKKCFHHSMVWCQKKQLMTRKSMATNVNHKPSIITKPHSAVFVGQSNDQLLSIPTYTESRRSV